MLSKDRIVLFGPPGVGKSSVGRMLTDHGYFYFNGDEHSLPEGVALNKKGMGLTPELRDRDYAHITGSFIAATKFHTLIAMDYHFMFDRYRLALRSLDPSIRWIYLTAQFDDLASRLNRPGHMLTDINFIQKIFTMFEEPTFPVKRIDATLPIEDVVRQVLSF